MPSTLSSNDYAQNLVQHVRRGFAPDSEELVSSELPPDALPEVFKQLKAAKDELTVEVASQSKEAEPDLRGWISQTKQLQNDILYSQNASDSISEADSALKKLNLECKDSHEKIVFLEKELAFAHQLQNTLGRFLALRNKLDYIERCIGDDSISDAVDQLQLAERDLSSISGRSLINASRAFVARTAELRKTASLRIRAQWNASVIWSPKIAALEVKSDGSGESGSLYSTVEALRRLGALDEVLHDFCRATEINFLRPRLTLGRDGKIATFEVVSDRINGTQRTSDLSAEALLEDITSLIDFIRGHLPTDAVDQIAKQIMPLIVSRLINTWLLSAIPDVLEGLDGFQETLKLVRTFVTHLEAISFPGTIGLRDWIRNIPSTWIRKRQERSLNLVRKLLSEGVSQAETVERTETQILSSDDDIFAAATETEDGDDWNANWDDDDTHPVSKPDSNNVGQGLGDGGGKASASEQQTEQEEDSADAWGWGDEDDTEPPHDASGVVLSSPSVDKPTADPEPRVPAKRRQVTLRETIAISSLPRKIFLIVEQVIEETVTLSRSEGSQPFGITAASLAPLPELIFALYRAGAFIAYDSNPNGNIFLYNDALWLSREFTGMVIVWDKADPDGHVAKCLDRLEMSNILPSLEGFGKRAYAREMETQRTIINDLMDCAQGFNSCTQYPFNQACDIATASAVDRLRHLHLEWRQILSHSALLQSLGSILNSLCLKFINDVEDMSDISEPESQQLARYCSKIASLEDLFRPNAADTPEGAEAQGQPVTGLYTQSWFKFQYLANILESSLADIKYMWTEGELGLEFQTDEVVDLILALFADSPHRRSAIAEIRGHARDS